jgi:hypothetical protein
MWRRAYAARFVDLIEGAGPPGDCCLTAVTNAVTATARGGGGPTAAPFQTPHPAVTASYSAYRNVHGSTPWSGDHLFDQLKHLIPGVYERARLRSRPLIRSKGNKSLAATPKNEAATEAPGTVPL